jgi:competence protein ComEA
MPLRTSVLAALALIMGVGAGVLLSTVCSGPPPVIVQFGDARTSGSQIRVYVSGAVRSPGVYPLHEGDRVVDAVAAAGGPAGDADTEAVHFAQALRDGQDLHVPRVGEPAPSPEAGAPSGGSERVDLNRADVALIRSLPGVGATRAANIVNSRQRDGPFQRPDDLLQRKLLTPSVYSQVKDLVEVSP